MFSQCKKYFTKHRGAIVVILIASLINAALGTVSPYITGSIVTRISNRYPPQAIFVGCCVLLAIYLVSQVIGFVVGLIRIKTEICMGEEFNSDVIFYVQDLPYAFIQKQNITVLNQAINQDTIYSYRILFRYTFKRFDTSSFIICIASTLLLYQSTYDVCHRLVCFSIYCNISKNETSHFQRSQRVQSQRKHILFKTF